MVRLLFLCASFLLLASCGVVSKLKPGKKEDDFGKIPEIPSHLRAGGEAATVKITPTEDRVVALGVDPASLTIEQGGVAGLTPESDLIFTDPDDVEGSEAAIQGLFKDEEKDWYQSHTVAKNRALLESKPLLIVFTDTAAGQGGSGPVARLERELLARNDFADWARKNVIRLKLDFNQKDRHSADPAKQSVALEKEKYLKSLRKRYKVGGFPAMIMVAADGTVVQHVRGFQKGAGEFTWGLLKQGVVISDERQRKFEAKLEKKGYRRWTGQNDQTIFARLAKYRDGELLLFAPNGNRFITNEDNLSKSDKNWLESQKSKRLGRR